MARLLIVGEENPDISNMLSAYFVERDYQVQTVDTVDQQKYASEPHQAQFCLRRTPQVRPASSMTEASIHRMPGRFST